MTREEFVRAVVASAPPLTPEQSRQLQGVLLSVADGPERAPELDAQRPSTRFSKSIPSFGETGDNCKLPGRTDTAADRGDTARQLELVGGPRWARS